MTMNEKDLKNLCVSRLRQAESAQTTISDDRALAQKYYDCELFGDEKAGRSRFVASDVRDTIEWMLPQLVEMFVGDDCPASFLPVKAEDVEPAAIETDYIRHVYNVQNNGFINTYSMIKDGLLYKNGVAKIFWDERVDERQETYEGLDFVAFSKLQIDPQITIDEVTVRLSVTDQADEAVEITLDEAAALGPMAMRAATYDAKCTRKEDNSQARVVVIPPENFFVDPNHNSLDLSDAAFCCHRDIVRRSDLIVDGYAVDLVESIPHGDDSDTTQERIERDDDSSFEEDLDDELVTIYECYIRADFDGDGKNSLHMVKFAGKDCAVLLDDEPVDSVPFAAWSPLIVTHRFFGKSIAELVTDIQRLRSVLIRQILDNIYRTNNPGKVIVEGRVNKTDLLNSSIGAVIRAQSLDAIRDETTPFMAGAALPILSLVDEMRSERTGVSPTSQGIDPAALTQSTNLVGSMVMTQALARIKMVGRIFAETAYKSIVLRLHELCSKHDRQRVFQRAGDNYTDVNPREWTRRTGLKISVGIGSSDKAQRIAAIGEIIRNQSQIMQAGGADNPLVSLDNLYQALVEQAKLLGYPDGQKFYRDPATYQPMPKEDVASEALQIEQARLTYEAQAAAVQSQIKLRQHEDTIALEREKMAMNDALEREKLASDRDLEREKMLLQYGGLK